MSDIQQAHTTRSPRLVLILGGARSGKSTFAERLAAHSGRSVAFLATATASDEEMRERIARHRTSRPAHWLTIEVSDPASWMKASGEQSWQSEQVKPHDLASALRYASERADVLLLDCMTLWLGNRMGSMSGIETLDQETVAFQTAFTDAVNEDIDYLLDGIASLPEGKTLLIVSNEVGLGIVPAYALGRVYRDVLGLVNQRLAQAANRVYLMIAGLAVDIKRLHEEARL
jgi:adenosylcobinamide kinase/adenosylcobinamide-phosphate guanylyltransferase